MGVAFDPISAASTSSDITLSLLLNHERLNRIILQSSMNTGISIDNIFEALFKFLTSNNNQFYQEGYRTIVQDVVSENIIKHFMNIIVNDKYMSHVRAKANYYLNQLLYFLNNRVRNSTHHHHDLRGSHYQQNL